MSNENKEETVLNVEKKEQEEELVHTNNLSPQEFLTHSLLYSLKKINN